MPRTLVLSSESASFIRLEIARARGNEVCFLAQVDAEGAVVSPRVVARGNRNAVLAAVRDAEYGSVAIHNHPTGDLEPSEADMRVASDLYAQGCGLAIVDNDARELYVVVEPPSARSYELLDADEVAALLAPGGLISRAHRGYEDRPMQRDMARAVTDAYNRGGITIAEAGTGTGKSIAYLVPAIRWAVANRERTIISTNTINLQEQLVEKDLPFLRRSLGEAFRFALVKGRRNYVSIRRAKLAAASEGLLFASTGEQSELQAIVEWIENSSDGSLQDLPFAPTAEVWDEVASEPDVCMRAKCPHFDQCFYQRARRDAASADLLVVNHHLLFSDVAVRRAQGNYSAPAVLPAYKRIILDEAHNLEDAATEHLGANVSRRGIARLLGRLDRRGRGLLGTVEGKLYSGEQDLLQQDALKRVAKLRVMIERAREQSGELFNALENMLARSEDGVLRLTEDFALNPDWTYASAASFEGTVMVLETITRDLAQLRSALLVDERWAKALEEQLLELDASGARVRASVEALRLVFTPAPGGVQLVRWLERRGGIAREPNVSARAAPVDISQTLREALFEQAETVVLTSATLATRNGFGFLRQRIGLGAGLRVTEALYPSPFDYEEQALVLVTSDAPMEFGSDFDARTVQTILDVAAASDGGVFALFTSYRALRNVARDLRLQGVEARWPLFVQGEGSRTRLLERFAQSGRGILLGVSSFWEGVDVPGHPLRALVITKLPFKVPSEPLTAARIEAIDADGRNSFIEYMLPHAALRLKQGFGRLIRSRTDRGVIVLQDRRLLDKSYGRYFLDSLPPARVQSGPWHELRPLVDAFYGRHAPLEAAS